ncbi:hypothetical protein EAH89_22960 [Roseomonas nepalensis]|uniref:Uncharacterized protein n=1 Tax=Muricoccus nepalensis TaxID=1854500 RepID=A0A502FG03_9PROT|nr:hypothetical protein [Roseomonas nepalensis]TPG48162.1 hypothetical protein EAH89_22960 [Roseomonas nepalensis]
MPAHQIPATETRARESQALESRTLASLAEIANDNLAEPRRHEAAARVLNAAREVRGLVGEAAREAGQPVEAIAAGWDPRAVTALEFAETLPVPTLDGLLGDAPGWARAMRALIAAQEPGSAAA